MEYQADLHFENKKGHTAISYALNSDDVDLVIQSLDYVGDINKINKAHQPLLVYFATHNSTKGIDKAVEIGADIDATDNNGNTTLIATVLSRQHTNVKSNIISKLMEHKANINFKNNKGHSAMFYAMNSDDVYLVMQLLDHGSDVNETNQAGVPLLVYFATNNCIKGIDKAVNLGANIDATDNSGNTPSIAIVLSERVKKKSKSKIISKLMEYRPNINFKNNQKHTAIFYAMNSDDVDLVMQLLDYGSDVNEINEAHQPILVYFVAQNFIQGIDKAVELGADIDATDDKGCTALMVAVQRNFRSVHCQEMVSKLIEHHANINLKDKQERTALFYAMRNKDALRTKQLIRAGATTDTLTNAMEDRLKKYNLYYNVKGNSDI